MKDDVDDKYREFSRLGKVKILGGRTMRSRLFVVGKERKVCVCVLDPPFDRRNFGLTTRS